MFSTSPFVSSGSGGGNGDGNGSGNDGQGVFLLLPFCRGDDGSVGFGNNSGGGEGDGGSGYGNWGGGVIVVQSLPLPFCPPLKPNCNLRN